MLTCDVFFLLCAKQKFIVSQKHKKCDTVERLCIVMAIIIITFLDVKNLMLEPELATLYTAKYMLTFIF